MRRGSSSTSDPVGEPERSLLGKHVLQHSSTRVLEIPGRREQDGVFEGSPSAQLVERVPCGEGRELGPVPALELGEALRSLSIPSPQTSTGGNLFRPRIERRIGPGELAGPLAIDEHPVVRALMDIVVDVGDVDLRRARRSGVFGGGRRAREPVRPLDRAEAFPRTG